MASLEGDHSRPIPVIRLALLFLHLQPALPTFAANAKLKQSRNHECGQGALSLQLRQRLLVLRSGPTLIEQKNRLRRQAEVGQLLQFHLPDWPHSAYIENVGDGGH